MHNKQRGFTLIELLVVIAIIGILSAVVIASMVQSREQARDASAMESMHSIRNQAEVWVNENGIYPNNLCSNPSYGVKEVVASVKQLTSNNPRCATNVPENNSWAAEVKLNRTDPATNKPIFFCVDSNGRAGKFVSQNHTINPPADTECGP